MIKSIKYGTEITSDVLGWLAEDEVTGIMARIAALPPVQSEWR